MFNPEVINWFFYVNDHVGCFYTLIKFIIINNNNNNTLIIVFQFISIWILWIWI